MMQVTPCYGNVQWKYLNIALITRQCQLDAINTQKINWNTQNWSNPIELWCSNEIKLINSTFRTILVKDPLWLIIVWFANNRNLPNFLCLIVFDWFEKIDWHRLVIRLSLVYLKFIWPVVIFQWFCNNEKNNEKHLLLGAQSHYRCLFAWKWRG